MKKASLTVLKSIQKCLCLSLCCLTSLGLKAQNAPFCATLPDVPDFLKTVTKPQLKSAVNSYTLQIFIHVIKRSDGSGGQTQQEVNTAFNTLVSDYQPYNINFVLLGTDEIRSDTYYNYNSGANFTNATGQTDADSDGKFDVFSPNSHPNAIDIYLFANDHLNFGLSANIPGTALVIGGNSFQTNLASSHVLSHEVGHCLGLFHTFHGSSVESEGSCPELVNGSNGNTCGDFVQDTPADPDYIFDCGTQSTCTWNCSSSYTDANGERYSPNTNLIMAYTFPNCMTQHTSGQISRIFNVIANSCILQRIINTFISGPTLVCSSGGTFTVNNLPSGNSVNWSVGPNLTITSGQNTNLCTITSAGNNSSWVSATIVNGCGNVTLPQLNVWCGKPLFSLDGDQELFPGEIGFANINYTYTGNPLGQAVTGVTWGYTGPITSITGNTVQGRYKAKLTGGGTGYVYANATNACGTIKSSLFYRVLESYAIAVSPNPASGTVEINITKTTTDSTGLSPAIQTEEAITETKIIRIVNTYGTPVYSTQKQENKFTFPVSGLKNGTYIIEIKIGENVYTKQLIVKH